MAKEEYGPFNKKVTFWKENLQQLSLYGIEFICPVNDLRPVGFKLPEFPNAVQHSGMNSHMTDRYGYPYKR